MASESESEELDVVYAPTPLKKKSTLSTMKPAANIYMMDRLMTHLDRAFPDFKYRREFAMQVARYWALKRGSRHGAPLLKRLHLEVFAFPRFSLFSLFFAFALFINVVSHGPRIHPR